MLGDDCKNPHEELRREQGRFGSGSPATLEVPVETYCCSNCRMNDKVDKLPNKVACYSTWHLKQKPYPTAEKLTMEVYLYHTGCPNGDNWRADNDESGFPRFYAILHERYAPQSVTLECEACGTTIKHGFAHVTEIDSL